MLTFISTGSITLKYRYTQETVYKKVRVRECVRACGGKISSGSEGRL